MGQRHVGSTHYSDASRRNEHRRIVRGLQPHHGSPQYRRRDRVGSQLQRSNQRTDASDRQRIRRNRMRGKYLLRASNGHARIVVRNGRGIPDAERRNQRPRARRATGFRRLDAGRRQYVRSHQHHQSGPEPRFGIAVDADVRVHPRKCDGFRNRLHTVVGGNFGTPRLWRRRSRVPPVFKAR